MGFYIEALEYAAKGYRIFPLKGKVPYTAHGFEDAVAINENDGQSAVDVEYQVYKWWSRWPTANIGMVVPDEVVVLDFDPRNGGTIASLGELPPTFTVVSGRGDGGAHRYYMRPALPDGATFTDTRLPECVDLKHNGYIVVPPSIHPEGQQKAYLSVSLPVVPLPEHIAALIIRLPAPKTYTLPSPWRLGGGGKSDGLVASVAEARQGNRNHLLYWAACTAREEGTLGDILEQLVEAALSAGLPEFEARRTIASAGRGD